MVYLNYKYIGKDSSLRNEKRAKKNEKYTRNYRE
ncbi:Uncharacterised protein [Clostridioides difficile]|nr:Uncharacterised protein [Clostridioides difficile]